MTDTSSLPLGKDGEQWGTRVSNGVTKQKGLNRYILPYKSMV